MISPADIHKASILIVDDLKANVAVLDQMLRGAGYLSVASTQNPREVCELHRRHRYDLILLDLQMPGLDGFQVMEGLKEIEPGGYLPVLVITAQPGHMLRALKSGAKDFISKPFDLGEVLVRVYNMLEVRLLHRNENRLSAARLENSQRIAGLGDWEYDFTTHRLLWSEEVYRILGIARKDCAPDSAIFYRQVHPDDLDHVHREKKAAAEGRRRVDFEHRIIRPDGEVRHIHQITGMVFDDQGRPAQESGTIQDVTERKAAETALRQSEEHYRLMFQRNPSPMWVFDPKNFSFLTVNDAAVHLYGFSREEFLRMTVMEIRPPEHVTEFLESMGSTPPQTRTGHRSHHRKKDGTVFPVDIFAHEFNFEGRVTRLVLVVDQTEADRAAAAVRESEERFKLVARAVSDVVWDWDLAANTLWLNEGFLVSFGYAAGEIQPGLESWTKRIHPTDRSRVADSLHHALDGVEKSWSGEYRLQHKDGHYAYVQDRGYILRDAGGRAIRMVGGMRDLTEQKKMEAQYLRAQRMDGIGTLAGGIAHDLNNVLAPILMSIELLKLDTGPDPRRSKILETIHVSCQRGADLVKQVLSFARGVDGEKVAVRLRHVVNDFEGIVNETFPRNIRVSTKVPNDLWTIMGDPTQLHQILLNLAVNARDAMPRGGTLTISTENFLVDAQYAGTGHAVKPGPYVLLQVTDTGEGIPPGVRERIFDPFFTTKEFGKGTGIGLATVHTIVKNHGGFLQVESEVGQGTTFKIYLPADENLQAAGSLHPFPVDLPHGRNELVLVVDDEFSIRHITQQTLAAFGYRVITAGDGAEALAIYAQRAKEISLVLTDMMMPVMDGAAVIQVLMRMNPNIRIIVASGSLAGDRTFKAQALGVTDFLPKPYTAIALLRLFREVLDRPAAHPVVAAPHDGHFRSA